MKSLSERSYYSYRIAVTKTSTLLSRDEYNKIIADFTTIESSGKKMPSQYYLRKKYEVIKCGDDDVIRDCSSLEDGKVQKIKFILLLY